MRIMLVAATSLEIAPALEWLQKNEFRSNSGICIQPIITGVGSMQTAYQLTAAICSQKPVFLLQAGIAGSFSPDFPPGTLAIVQEEFLGDLGVDENGSFRDIFDLNLQNPDEFPYTAKGLANPYLQKLTSPGLPLVNSVTINQITTSPERIQWLQQNYSAIVESMEGAAFHYVALQQQIPFLQLRCISNMVGERDKKKWLLKESIATLNNQLIQWLQDPEIFVKNNR